VDSLTALEAAEAAAASRLRMTGSVMGIMRRSEVAEGGGLMVSGPEETIT